MITVLCRGHCLNNVASVRWMIVAVIADKFAVVFVRCEKSGFAFLRFDDMKIAVTVSRNFERLKKLPPIVEFKGARIFLFVYDVGRGARGDTDRTCRKFDHRARIVKFSRFRYII